ncbi:cytochrome P450 [Streptomyces caniscabiei]|uniref:cytochrome P450 n=1 Tax=Streptomyces caniscabiei TaxID=2746961 RepID=UPI0029B81A25|nr:cytochrome P450 [Streptomyces caniscabiei]MDX2600222.1 cytochrome P450 [Streptomyces caniscabiei]MDX2741595.1 cytochrome P450 [Streptomyces caniscabiei]MDX2782642.1 cytochrome P450 [Streptomyces caniscabiei]
MSTPTMAAPGAPVVDLDLAELRRDPYPAYASLRRTAPVAWVPSVGRHLLTRYEDIVHAEKTPEVFSSREQGSLLLRTVGPNLLREDGPQHRRLRTAAEPPTRPRQVRDLWARAFEQNAHDLLERIAGRGEADLIADFAEPLAAVNLALVLGLRNATADDIADWSRAMMAANGNYADDPDVWLRAERATRAIEEAVAEIAEAVRTEPDGSVISSMVHADIALPEIQNNVKVVIGGGVNEPRDVFGVGARALLDRPDVRDRVLGEPALWKRVFEETARWVSPIGMYPRQLLQDHEIGGVTLPAGSRVALVIASGNRDESVFERADTFDIDRPHRAHLAFGGGPHFCMGAWVARHEISALAWPLVFGRLANLRLDGNAADRMEGWVFRGLTSLHVTWQAA